MTVGSTVSMLRDTEGQVRRPSSHLKIQDGCSACEHGLERIRGEGKKGLGEAKGRRPVSTGMTWPRVQHVRISGSRVEGIGTTLA
jgi:hypothetical protein